MGAAGRIFMYLIYTLGSNALYDVVAFTATQIRTLKVENILLF